MTDLTNISEVKRLLQTFDLHPNKVMGQHFLVSRRVLDRILEAADITPEDTVLEVGPGLGTLTVELARRARRVIAVEKDARFIPVLKETLSPYANIEVVHDDILAFDPTTYALEPTNYKLVADIPYYLTARLFRQFLESAYQPALMVVLVQKEIAERIAATPPNASLLSDAVQYYALPKNITSASASCFFPVPGVDSKVISLAVKRKYDRFLDVRFFAMLKLIFSQPRKQVINNLSGRYQREFVIKTLNEAGISENIRAHELTIEQILRLSNVLSVM